MPNDSFENLARLRFFGPAEVHRSRFILPLMACVARFALSCSDFCAFQGW